MNIRSSKPTTRSTVAAMLRGCRITPTHQRMEIALLLFARQQHLSADQILALVNRRHAETSKATVYNTLKLFLEKKLVREVIVDPAKVFYDPNTGPHHHIYDVETGELTDVDPSSVNIASLPELPPGMVTEGVDVIIRIRRAQPEEIAAPRAAFR
jgi:Fur family transcriptional regulator, iron response regulator